MPRCGPGRGLRAAGHGAARQVAAADHAGALGPGGHRRLPGPARPVSLSWTRKTWLALRLAERPGQAGDLQDRGTVGAGRLEVRLVLAVEGEVDNARSEERRVGNGCR